MDGTELANQRGGDRWAAVRLLWAGHSTSDSAALSRAHVLPLPPFVQAGGTSAQGLRRPYFFCEEAAADEGAARRVEGVRSLGMLQAGIAAEPSSSTCVAEPSSSSHVGTAAPADFSAAE